MQKPKDPAKMTKAETISTVRQFINKVEAAIAKVEAGLDHRADIDLQLTVLLAGVCLQMQAVTPRDEVLGASISLYSGPRDGSVKDITRHNGMGGRIPQHILEMVESGFWSHHALKQLMAEMGGPDDANTLPMPNQKRRMLN